MHVSPARRTLAHLLKWVNEHRLFVIYFAAWFAYFTYFWMNALYIDERGAVQVGHVSIWGDWAAHFTMGSAMATRGLILLKSPFLYGAHFSYPFIANMISAVLQRLGMNFFSSFLIPSYLCSLLLIGVLYWFYLKLFKQHRIALIASLLFLLNGGTGFVYFISDVKNSANPWQTFVNPPVEYTSMQDHFIRWISVVNSQVVPQRAFTLGFPVALMVITLAWFYVLKDKVRSSVTLPLTTRHRREPLRMKLSVALTALLLGLLPIMHTHSFLAVGIILGFWFLVTMLDEPKERLRSWKLWLHIGIPAAIIALPLFYVFFMSNASGQGFIKWYPGWYLQEFKVNWFVFWFINWGVIPILALGTWIAHIFQRRSGRERLQEFLFYAPFFLLFILINLFLFQPFIWDNTKLLTWASLGFSGLAAQGLSQLWDRKSVSSRKHHLLTARAYAGRALIALIFLFSIFSGTIDAWRMIRFKLHTYQMYSTEEMGLVAWVKRNTRTDSLWVTGDTHNHWLFNLTGRQALMTYRGWMWTHGYNYTPMEAVVTAIYRDPLHATPYLEQYGVDYILIGFNEEGVWGANREYFDQLFPIVYQTTNYTIYQAKLVEPSQPPVEQTARP